MKERIGAILSYCTNDYRFLALALKSLQIFANEIVVSVSDHFFNGEEENQALLESSYAEHPDVTFFEYAFHDSERYGLHYPFRGGERERLFRLHGVNRYVGYHGLSKNIDWILFVDVDEIFDGKAFFEWMQKRPEGYDLYHFSSYVYVMKESLRLDYHQNTALLVRAETFESELILNAHERPGYFFEYAGPKLRSVRSLEGKPMVHHYNWVRSKEELIRKVKSWGHREDKDWVRILEEGRIDELTGGTLREVKPIHDILSLDVASKRRKRWLKSRAQFSHVHKITPESLFKMAIEKRYLEG